MRIRTRAGVLGIGGVGGSRFVGLAFPGSRQRDTESRGPRRPEGVSRPARGDEGKKRGDGGEVPSFEHGDPEGDGMRGLHKEEKRVRG